MKEELITFETAKLAKEKKYILETNDISFTCYRDSDKKSSHSKLKRCYPNYIEEYFKDEGFYTFPTQSLLQKWLREVHGIDIFIYYTAKFQKNYLYNYTLVKKINLCKKSLNYKTYEEALEIGLQEALKLIPNG